jgi:hypothetical protein
MSESPGGTTNRMKKEAENLGQEAQQKVSEVKEQGSVKAREELDRRTNQLGRQTISLAEALRRTGQDMQQQGQGNGVDRVTSGVADRLERVGGYLEGARGENMLRDAEQFARQHAWLVAGGAAFAGLLASRFLKASSEGRYDRDVRAGRTGRYTWSPGTTSDLYAETDPELGPYGRVEQPVPAGRSV